MSVLRTIREHAGVLIKDRARYEAALSTTSTLENGDPAWVGLKNRLEELDANPDGPGVRCPWDGSSKLHACGLRPSWGRRLMERAFDDWPIRFADTPQGQNGPKVSFIFAHGGVDRLPLLQQTIRAVFAQEDVTVEVIVVDQSDEACGGQLPGDVSYVHLSSDHLTPGWRKSWAFNVGARNATGDILIFQDGDILPPARYAAEVAERLLGDGFATASIQRFLFYLTKPATDAVIQTGRVAPSPPETVLQNWTGGTIAVARDAFFDVGGFDEGFVDWGGEDGEFFDRCRTLKQTTFGYVPFVHLWHQPQTGRKDASNTSIAETLPTLLQRERSSRIASLRERQIGQLAGPDPPVSYREAGVA